MSHPKNGEQAMAQPNDIEDVLSSIRRLVANEGNGAAAVERSRAPQPEVEVAPEEGVADVSAPDEAPKDADAEEEVALVLAPAQRVTDPEDPFQMIRSLAQEERDARDAAHVLEDVDGTSAGITTDIETESPVTEAFEDLLPEARPDEPEAVPEDYQEDADYDAAAPSPIEVGDDAVMENLVEELTAGAAARFATRRSAALDTQPESDPATEETPASPDEAVVAEAATASDDAAAAFFQSDSAPTPEDIVETAPPRQTAEPRGDSSETAEQVDLSDLSSQVGGDDALRELIADVVRQELSGALGERITRNVRKLVRREIRSLMSSGEFD